MNFSESRQNRFRENREKSKNRFFFPPPLLDMLILGHISHSSIWLAWQYGHRRPIQVQQPLPAWVNGQSYWNLHNGIEKIYNIYPIANKSAITCHYNKLQHFKYYNSTCFPLFLFLTFKISFVFKSVSFSKFKWSSITSQIIKPFATWGSSHNILGPRWLLIKLIIIIVLYTPVLL